MCNLYSITTNQAAIIALFRVVNRYVGNLPPMPGVFPDYDGKNAAAVALGRMGGKARAAGKLSAKKRKEIAKKAAATRWKSVFQISGWVF